MATADGIKIGESFTVEVISVTKERGEQKVGEDQMRFPRDPRGDISPANIVNCRCSLITLNPEDR
jgi:hypothetical protein